MCEPCSRLGVPSPSLGLQQRQHVGGQVGGTGGLAVDTPGPLGSREPPSCGLVHSWPAGQWVLVLVGHLRSQGASKLPRKAQLCPHGRSLRRSCAPCWDRSSRSCTPSPPSTFWTEPSLTGPQHPPTTYPCTVVRDCGCSDAVLSPWLCASALFPHPVADVPGEPGAFLYHIPGGERLLSSSPFTCLRTGAGGGVCVWGEEPTDLTATG